MSQGKLKDHIRKIHPTSDTAEIIRREDDENRQEAQCPYCLKLLSRRDKLNRHIRTIHADKKHKFENPKTLLNSLQKALLQMEAKAERVQCEFCNKILSRKDKLNSHIRAVHPDVDHKANTEPMPESSTLVPRDSKSGINERVQCPYCSKSLSRKDKLTRHIRTVHTDVTYKCEVCQKEFFSKGLYNRHMFTHREQQSFECDCGYITNRKFKLTEHVRRKHLKDYKVLCPICGYGCFYNAELKEHITSVHNGERPECPICLKTFAKRRNLDLHNKRFHDKSSNTLCPQCGKGFASQGRLNEHLTQVHPPQKHQCHICHKIVVSAKTLKKHLLLHTDSEPFHCAECGKAFKFKRYVTLHMRTHTGQYPTFNCKVCHQTVSCEFRSKHMATHDVEKRFLCPMCSAAFIDDSGLKAHMRKHQEYYAMQPLTTLADLPSLPVPNNEKPRLSEKKHRYHSSPGSQKRSGPVPCPLCDKLIASEAKLRDHIRKIHPDSDRAELIRLERKCQCPYCEKILSRRDKLTRHIRAVHPNVDHNFSSRVHPLDPAILSEMKGNERVQCQFCAKFLSRKDKLIRHIKTIHTDVIHKCKICDEEFPSRQLYRQHLVIHKEPQRYECDCGYFSDKKHKLTEHIRRKHLKDYKVLCPVCGYGCFNNAELKAHVMASHSIDRPKCDTCGQTFSRMRNLKLHIMRFHDKSNNTLCPDCGKGFPSMGLLNQHITQVHPPMKHQCHICNKVVVSAKTLKRHMQLHSNTEPYHCAECGKSFKCKRYVTLHMRTHTGQYPTFNCKICHQAISCEFRAKHMATHDVAKNFLCSICSAGFMDEMGLKAHMRKHQDQYALEPMQNYVTLASLEPLKYEQR